MIDLSQYKTRLMDETLKQALGLFKAVCLEGPKWCGKTWTGVKHSHSQFFIGDPQGNFAHRELARSDPADIVQ